MFLDKNAIMVEYPIRSGNPTAMGLYVKNGNNFTLTSDTTFQSGTSYYLCMGLYLVEVKYTYNKLWANDSGRNLAGTMSGTLLGIFPKLVMQFRTLSKSELELIIPILDNANQKIWYYDPNKKALTQMTTYTGDYEILNKGIITEYMKNEGFSCSFIAVRKRA